MRDNGDCVLSGFHSDLEKEVLRILLKGTQPIILATARTLPKRPVRELQQALDDNRLLIVAPFDGSTPRITKKSAHIRNQFILSIAQQAVIGHADQKGSLIRALQEVPAEKNVTYLTD